MLGQQVINWFLFITPFAKYLEQIKTLVFVQDGVLWTIPIGTLYDGKQFLVEKYAIRNTPSLSLTSPQPLNTKDLKILAFGLTDTSAIDKNTFFPPVVIR
ncbi:MAG: CHAT domain-containing protein [Rivularia sp. (in: cyanobacteria)]